MIYSCCNLVTSNIATVINNNDVSTGECFRMSWYKQTSDLFISQNKESTYMDEQETISI